jgi:hypothetical protein
MDQVQETTSPGAETLNSETTSTESTTSTVPATEEAAGGVAGHIAKVQAAQAGGVPAAVEAYKPNFKFKAADKELEFDDFIRDAVKNAEHEKKLRELYEKAYGLDHVKAERERFRNEYKTVNEQYSALNKGLDQLSIMLRNKDYHGFFNALKLPEQDILQYALSRVQYSQLPPEQRQKLDQQYESQQRLSYLEQANQELIAEYQGQMVQQRSQELDGYLGRPEVSQVAAAFDARVGRQGAFKDEVIRRGQYYASLPEAQDIPVEQAVREIMTLVGNIAPQATPAQAQTQMDGMQSSFEQQPQAAQQPKPVIPNIKGRGTSPAKKVVKSIDDLRKMHASME